MIDAAAEAAECLREFAAERAATDDQHPLRQLGDAEDGFVGVVGNAIEAGDVGDVGFRTGRDQGLAEPQRRAVDFQLVRGGETGMAEKQVDAGFLQRPR